VDSTDIGRWYTYK